MIELVATALAALATGVAGFAVGRWGWPREVAVIATGATETALSTDVPKACSQKGHDPHIKGTVMRDGKKHAVTYCTNEGCGREWLRPL